jgi:hypothetical protein
MLSATPLPVPAGISAGRYDVSAEGQISARRAEAVLWIQDSPPSLQLSKDALRPEAKLAISGTGFAPSERVVIYFEGNASEPLTAIATDQAGNFRAESIPVPLVAAGERQIIATGSLSLAQAKQPFQVLQFDPIVIANADTVPAGEPVSFFGYGFATRDQIDIALEGGEEPPVTVKTDDKGFLVALRAIQLPAGMQGPSTFILRGHRTNLTIRTTVQVVESFPHAELSNHFGKAGSEVTLSVRFLRPRERLEVFIGEGSRRKKLATFRADENGWLPGDSRFQIPQDAPTGTLALMLEGEASRSPLRVRFQVLP